ncbi:MAG: Ig-like domain-containing protein, partial [Gardnerella vaginalis]
PSKNGVNGDPVTTTVTDETPAEKPAVSGQKAENKTGKDKTTVSGKTTPGAKVTISKDGQKVGEVTAENDGSFTVDIDKQTPNTTLTLTPSKNGVNGDPVTTTVTDETPAEKPAAPTVTTPTSGNDQGSATITPATGTDTLEITYTPENETTPKTITVKKGNDNKWKIDGNTPDGVTVNETTGEVTIPANKVKDNSDVTAKNSKNGTNSDEKTGQTGTNNGNSGSGSGSGTGSDSGSGSETGNSNSSESDSGNDSTSNNGGSDSGSTTGGSSSTDSGAQNSTNKSSSTDNANNAGNAETGNAETGNAGNGKAGNASTGASGSNASAKSGNKAPAKHSSQLVNTGAEVERVGLISAMISVLGAAAAFFSRKKNRE